MSISDLPENDRLIQLAEESAELAKAALKVIRAKKRDTPITETDARLNLLEEIADVLVCVSVLTTGGDRARIRQIRQRKKERWENRICLREKGEPI